MKYLKSLVLTLALLATLASAGTVPGGFLFVTFKGEGSPMTEQIHFALSRDGRDWAALNQGDPVLVTGLGEKGARDPYLLRSHDGKKFYLIATDLSINLNRHDWKRAVQAGSRSILVWESTDLVNWSEPRLVKVAPDDAGCTWAPEAVYDEENGDYLVFWASTTRRDEFARHRIWAARTKDFVTFGEPFIFIEKPTTIIDTTIVRDGGVYYRFTKDEKYKAITLESADRLAGPWRDIPEFSLGRLVGYEGPECYLIEPATGGRPPVWGLILDHYAKGQGYQPYTTHDLASGKFEPAAGFSFPFKFRHGSVLPITGEEFARLNRRWGEHPGRAVRSVSPAVRTDNLALDWSRGTLELLLKPGADPRSFDPRLVVPAGASIEPAGPQDFSRGPVAYAVRGEGLEEVVLHVSAAVRGNPVLPGYFADPDILWSAQTGRFYIYPTSDGYPGWGGTRFKAFSSPDLVEWKDEGVILDLPRDVSWAKRNAWAPCIIEKKTADGYRYYYYFTAAQKIGVATGEHPAGPFVDSGRALVDFRPDGVKHGQEIDPEVFTDPKTGKNYLYWGNGYLAVAELNDDMVSIRRETIRVITPDKTFREGATVFFRDGLYYVLWSEDDTGSVNYRVRYATAPTPLGPLTMPADNLVIAKDPAAGIYGTGHNSVLQIPGRDEWYIVYHRFNYPKGIGMGRDAGHHREVCIDRMSFDSAGNIIPVKPTHDGVPGLIFDASARSTQPHLRNPRRLNGW
jgi:beta-xylosidase